MKKKFAMIFLSIISILYIFDIDLFSANRFLQVIIGLLVLLSLYILAKKYNIEYVLTILSFSNHKLKDILIGQHPYDNLEDFVKGKQQKKELVLNVIKLRNGIGNPLSLFFLLVIVLNIFRLFLENI